MHLQLDNNREKTASVAAAIKTDPCSWRDWNVLTIEFVFDDISQPNYISRDLIELIETHVKEIEGSAFLYDDNGFCLLCKDTKTYILTDIGRQGVRLADKSEGVSCRYDLYELAYCPQDFVRKIFGDMNQEISLDLISDSSKAAEDISFLSRNRNTKPTILLVEDDTVSQCLVANALQDRCKVIYTAKANSVFSLYDLYEPNLILLDIGLPDNDGKNILKWIMDKDPGAAVVMLSGNGNTKNITECIENGAKGFISKPFASEDLYHYIEKYA